MSAQDDNRRWTFLDPMFCHAIAPRTAATITLASMIVVLSASTLLVIISPPTAYSQNPKTIAPGSVVVATPPKPIRVIGMTPRPELACEQQTWPYIHQRCLVRSEAKLPIVSEPRTTDMSLVTRDDADLSPLTATGSTFVPQPIR